MFIKGSDMTLYFIRYRPNIIIDFSRVPGLYSLRVRVIRRGSIIVYKITGTGKNITRKTLGKSHVESKQIVCHYRNFLYSSVDTLSPFHGECCGRLHLDSRVFHFLHISLNGIFKKCLSGCRNCLF